MLSIHIKKFSNIIHKEIMNSSKKHPKKIPKKPLPKKLFSYVSFKKKKSFHCYNVDILCIFYSQHSYLCFLLVYASLSSILMVHFLNEIFCLLVVVKKHATSFVKFQWDRQSLGLRQTNVRIVALRHKRFQTDCYPICAWLASWRSLKEVACVSYHRREICPILYTDHGENSSK